MKGKRLRRVAGWLAAGWAGAMAGLGFVAAPLGFATLPRVDAARLASRVFEREAQIGLAVGAVLFVLTMQAARDAAERGQGSRFTADMLFALGALACVVAGYYGVEPWIEAARAGKGDASFALLHGVASGFFVLRCALAAGLAWRLGADPEISAPSPTSSTTGPSSSRA